VLKCTFFPLLISFLYFSEFLRSVGHIQSCSWNENFRSAFPVLVSFGIVWSSPVPL
jgi:Sec-independent protein secretion pathway component TatC